jgi:hypothetical protein
MYLSDAIYLAEQNIYGNLLEVNNELEIFLSQFQKYANYI